jgi:hypothetical protein
MATDCNLCHSNDDGNNPFIGISNGTGINPGVGCTGCHGRDYGGAIGSSGVGLRAHHINNDVLFCADCHGSDPAPLPENVKPIYFGTADTNADDPCNAGPANLENWSLFDTEGLDNDGDKIYDDADPDCGEPCEGDTDGNNQVDVDDLTNVILDWGNCCQFNGDVTGDGQVNVDDLTLVILAWGPC